MKVITSEGVTPSLLADELGIQRSGISHILSGRNNPSFDFLQKILTRFPKLSAEWLILGQGAMYKTAGTVVPDIFAQKAVAGQTYHSPTIPAMPEKIPSGEADKKKSPEPYPEKTHSTTIEKTIEKIITFYTDKTFTVYMPEE
jgi:transcriptional regulator with XRE-family HTH domain